MAEKAMFQEARDAIAQGQRSRACDLLTRLLRIDQNNPTYWLWMSSVVESTREQIYCLENVLQLEPDNIAARRGMILLGAQPAPESVTPAPIARRRWTVEEVDELKKDEAARATGIRAVLSNSVSRIVVYTGVGILVIAMLFFGVFGLGSKSGGLIGRVHLTITPKLWTQKPTVTLLPTNTPRVRTPTPTFTGPTPLWMLLEATYTSTPIYVDTPHPISEAYRAGIRSYHSDDLENMLQFMEQAAQLEPDAVDTHYYIGEVQRLLGDYEQALAAYETAISVNPSFAPAYLGRARIYLIVNPDLGVEEDLNQAISLDPNLVEAYLALAEYYLQQNNPEAALEVLDYAEDLAIESPLVHMYRAQAFLSLDDKDAALESAQLAHELDQTLLPAYLTLGQIYLQIGYPKRATDLLETYTLYETENAGAWASLGQALYDSGKSDKAMEAFNKSLDLDENINEVYLYRGYIFLDNEEGQIAVNEFFKARALVPDSFDACLGMGRALLVAGRLEDALRQIISCQNLVSDEKQHAAVLYWRALIFEAIGNYQSAADDWQELINFPSGIIPYTWKANAEKHLKDLTPTTIATTTVTPSPETATPKSTTPTQSQTMPTISPSPGR